MIKLRKQNSTTHPMPFLLVLSSDNITGATGLSPTVTISKESGAFVAANGSVTELGNGWYYLAGDATDRDTIGEFLLHAEGSGADPVDERYQIVQYDPFSVFDSNGRVDLATILGQDASGLLTSSGGSGSTAAGSGASGASDNLTTAINNIALEIANISANPKPYYVVPQGVAGEGHIISSTDYRRWLSEELKRLMEARQLIEGPWTVRSYGVAI